MKSGKLKAFYEKFSHSKAITALLLLFAGAGLGLLFLCFTVSGERGAMLLTYLKRPLIVFLNLLPPIFLLFFLWFLTGRAFVAYLITAPVLAGLSAANYFKLVFRDDPLMFGDLLLLKEAGNMLGRYRLFLSFSLVIAIALIVLGGVVLFFFAKARPAKHRLVPALIMLLLAFPISCLYTSSDIYNNKTANFERASQWSATQTYTSKGFLYPFLHSITSAFETPPDGYSEDDAAAALAKYSNIGISADKKVDIFAVMLESFNDFSKYGERLNLTGDPYREYHELEREAVRGDLITNIFAAGTISTERSFLTGTSELGAFRSPSNSYVWYLKEQGYTATGSHPCFHWFYNRLNINPNLGLDNYKFLEDHYGELSGGGVSPDRIFFPELWNVYQKDIEENPAPYFSFSVTYQGHGPYNTEACDWDETFVTPGVYSKETENILNNYLASVHSTGQEVSKFIDRFRGTERPVVILLFGDHNPWLGDGNSAYTELGIDLDTSQKQGFLNYYGTRYLIWANESAKKVLGNDFVGDGPMLSPNYLMGELFTLCGWEGDEYMQYARDLQKEFPVIEDTGMCINKEGELLNAAQEDGEIKEIWELYREVEYFRRSEFAYEDLLPEN